MLVNRITVGSHPCSPRPRYTTPTAATSPHSPAGLTALRRQRQSSDVVRAIVDVLVVPLTARESAGARRTAAYSAAAPHRHSSLWSLASAGTPGSSNASGADRGRQHAGSLEMSGQQIRTRTTSTRSTVEYCARTRPSSAVSASSTRLLVVQRSCQRMDS